MKFLELVIEVVTKADKAVNELDSIERKFKTTTAQASKMDRRLLSIGNSSLILGDRLTAAGARLTRFSAISGAVFAAGALGLNKFSKESSNLEESINAVNVVFKNGSDRILEFSENSAKAVGLSSSEFNQLSTETGALLSRVGKPMDEVATLTTDLAVRAADLASVFNTDVNLAMSAINQALRGETEAIRKFSADVTDASVQAFLLSKGIDKKVASLTQEEKTLFRLQLLLKQTESVSGDFKRTIDSQANAQRVLNSEWKNTQAVLGSALLPIKARFAKILSTLLEKFNNLSPSVQSFISKFLLFGVALAGVAALLAPVIFLFGKLFIVFGKLASAIAILNTVSKGGKFISFLSFFRANKGLVSSIRLISTAFKGIRVAALLMLAPFALVIAKIVALALVAEDLFRFFTGGKSVTGKLIDKFKEFKILGTVSDWFVSLKNIASSALSSIWNSFSQTFPKSALAIENLTKQFSILSNNIGGVGKTLILDGLKGIGSAFDFLKGLVDSSINAMTSAWDSFVSKFEDSEILAFFSNVGNGISDAGSDLATATGKLFSGLKNGAINGLDSIVSSGVNLVAAPVTQAANATNSFSVGEINIQSSNLTPGQADRFGGELTESLNRRSNNILHGTGGSSTN